MPESEGRLSELRPASTYRMRCTVVCVPTCGLRCSFGVRCNDRARNDIAENIFRLSGL